MAKEDRMGDWFIIIIIGYTRWYIKFYATGVEYTVWYMVKYSLIFTTVESQ